METDRLCEGEEVYKETAEIVKKNNMDKEIRYLCEAHEKYLRDLRSQYKGGLKEGEQRGIAIGEQRGIAIGKEQARKEDAQEIAELKAEVERLKMQLQNK